MESPFSARSKSHSRSPASPCCLLLVAALRTRLEPLFPALRGRKSTPPAAAAPGEQSQHTQWRTSSCRTAACTGARHTYAERARAWPRARVASCSTMPRSRHGNRTRLGALGGQNKAMSRGEDGKQPSGPSVAVGVSSKSNQQSAWAQEQQLVARTKTQISSSLKKCQLLLPPGGSSSSLGCSPLPAPPHGRAI